MSAAAVQAFQVATPAMIVGQSTTDCPPPLGLGDPFLLLGGDRLDAAGIPFDYMHEWQPELLQKVREGCASQIAAERPWFRTAPSVLVGVDGTGRTHAARRLAQVAGVPHVIVNLSDPVIATNLGTVGEMNEALWVSPLVIAMAATCCANPVVSVVGADLSPDAAMALATMIDPEQGRVWQEDRIDAVVDLGEVSWFVQVEDPLALPVPLREQLAVVPMRNPNWSLESDRTLSMILEVLSDLRIDILHPAVAWADLRARLAKGPWRTWQTTKDAYEAVRAAIIDAQYDFSMGTLPAGKT